MTGIPPAGAADEIFTDPVEVAPPISLEGLTVNEDSVGALTVKLVDNDFVPTVTVITDTVFTTTGTVVIGNVTLVLPAGTVTEGSVLAAEFAELSGTTTPFVPAFWDRVTIPVDETPPTTLAGNTLSLVTV